MTPKKQDDEFVQRGELTALLDTIRNELKWVKWGVGIALVGVYSPRVGGPSPPEIAHVVLNAFS